MRGSPFKGMSPAVVSFLLCSKVFADDVNDQAARFAAMMIAQTEFALNLCSHHFFVNESVVKGIQQDMFAPLSIGGDRRAKELVNEEIEKVLVEGHSVGEERWCSAYRDRMRALGGPGIDMFAE